MREKPVDSLIIHAIMGLKWEMFMEPNQSDLAHNQAVDACIERMKLKMVQLSRRIGYADAAWIEQSLQDAFNHLKR